MSFHCRSTQRSRGWRSSPLLQRIGLTESLLSENGEKPSAVLTRNIINAEMKARTSSQANNLPVGAACHDPVA